MTGDSNREDTHPHLRGERVAQHKLLHERDEDDATTAQQHPHARRDVGQARHHQEHGGEVEDCRHAKVQEQREGDGRLGSNGGLLLGSPLALMRLSTSEIPDRVVQIACQRTSQNSQRLAG